MNITLKENDVNWLLSRSGKLLIGGESRLAVSGKTFQSLNPATPGQEAGWQTSWSDYETARDASREIRDVIRTQIEKFDLVLTPSAPGEAPHSLASTGDSVFNRDWTLIGLPCVTVPFGSGANGLPLGLQLVGHHGSDMALLGWAGWITRALSLA